MQQVNLSTSASTYQSTGSKTSKSTDSKQTDFAEMIFGSKQTAKMKSEKISSKDEKNSVAGQDSKVSSKTEDNSKLEIKETKETEQTTENKETKEAKALSKDELSAEWLLQMQAMGLQVVQQDGESFEQASDAFAELQIEAVDVSAETLTQTAEQMPTVETSTDVTLSNLELSQENLSMEYAEALETEAQAGVSSGESVASVETLSEKPVFSEKVQEESDTVVAEFQPEQMQESSSEESQSTFDLETQQTSEVTSQSISKEDKDNKTDGEFHEELSLQQMQGQNLRMQHTFTEQTQETTATLKTTEQNLPENLGTKLAQSLPEQDGVLTIELEPVSLGKLTIQVVYEEGRTAVSIFASNPKTLEMLSENAGEIAQILEDKTGQEVTIYTPEAEKEWQEQPENQEKQNPREQEPQDRKKQSEPDSFAQQLRLGLV